ncbi:MAG: putative tricarboxylic transport rane protein [Burkholderiales bacterium]|jgi:putative tricarboxylic transport membrane protein
MKINDLLSGAALGALAAGVYLHARSFPPMVGQNVGPNLFPQLIAAGLMICAIILVVRGARSLGREALFEMPEWMGANRAALGFVMIPVALVFYIAVSERLGFIPTAVLLLLALFYVFGVRTRTALIVAVVGAVAIHAVFYSLLNVPLPWGILSPVAW